jgi:hypothetical protein
MPRNAMLSSQPAKRNYLAGEFRVASNAEKRGAEAEAMKQIYRATNIIGKSDVE